ncbi:RcnB family protein [Pseudomonas sp. NPDC090208]|uniref:RcnB family protein n=1 Tax=Pseudomonas sp. NPDC090208 TaxID=3364478 RepID=UPI00380F09E6
MARRKQLSCLAFTALCAFAGLIHAAGQPAAEHSTSEQPSVTLDRPGTGLREFKTGDVAPETYQRESSALKDWQARHLPTPDEHEQWVEIQGTYALINIPTGTIRQLISKSGAKTKP